MIAGHHQGLESAEQATTIMRKKSQGRSSWQADDKTALTEQESSDEASRQAPEQVPQVTAKHEKATETQQKTNSKQALGKHQSRASEHVLSKQQTKPRFGQSRCC
jgi:hypothetical protein